MGVAEAGRCHEPPEVQHSPVTHWNCLRARLHPVCVRAAPLIPNPASDADKFHKLPVLPLVQQPAAAAEIQFNQVPFIAGDGILVHVRQAVVELHELRDQQRPTKHVDLQCCHSLGVLRFFGRCLLIHVHDNHADGIPQCVTGFNHEVPPNDVAMVSAVQPENDEENGESREELRPGLHIELDIVSHLALVNREGIQHPEERERDDLWNHGSMQNEDGLYHRIRVILVVRQSVGSRLDHIANIGSLALLGSTGWRPVILQQRPFFHLYGRHAVWGNLKLLLTA
mmetsp:Transcript_79491/g.184467  ORF Transcript_79491/g.184467 Transcript_79491/m.184467 type:complete len:283 (-) Transcript_79491:23-871(-)